MNRKKETYDRLSAGSRIQEKRLLLGMTQDEMAEMIDRAPKYYADIERGSCGMSIETLIAVGKSLHLSLDYIIYGDCDNHENSKLYNEQTEAIIFQLSKLDSQRYVHAVRILKEYVAAYQKT